MLILSLLFNIVYVSRRDGRYLAAVCSTGVEIVDMQSSTVVSDFVNIYTEWFVTQPRRELLGQLF